jgi:predicted pyridoxine 5'-phosphate oxidase superfamily flavin-nucleotide-binding protein
MAQLTKRMIELFNEVPAAVLATVNGEGVPNAVPIGAKKILDDHTILISDQFFKKTLDNIKVNPGVSVLFWKGYEGYQLKGKVSILTSGQIFNETAQWISDLSAKVGFPLKTKGAVIFKIDEIYGVSPGPEAGKRLG